MTETIDAVKLRELVEKATPGPDAQLLALALAPTLARAYLSLTERAERAEKALREINRLIGPAHDQSRLSYDRLDLIRSLSTIAKTSPAEGEKKCPATPYSGEERRKGVKTRRRHQYNCDFYRRSDPGELGHRFGPYPADAADRRKP